MVRCRTVLTCSVLLVCALAGCTPQTPPHDHPEPTRVPTPSATPSPGEAEAEAAIEAFKAYQQMLVDTAMMGGYDIVDDGQESRPESVLATTMGDETEYVDGSNQRLKRDGERQVAGDTIIVSLDVVESVAVPDVPGGHRVVLTACVDRRSVVYEGAEGEREAPNAFIEETPTLYQDDAEPAGWKVALMSSRAVETC